MVNKANGEVICTAFSNGKRHDFRLYKESHSPVHPHTKLLADTGYCGMHKFHSNTLLPKKKTKKNPLSKQDKKANQQIASARALNENVIGMLKRFKIIADRYRNRRKRFALRFNLISAIYNFEING
jgi:hypothetical protein